LREVFFGPSGLRGKLWAKEKQSWLRNTEKLDIVVEIEEVRKDNRLMLQWSCLRTILTTMGLQLGEIVSMKTKPA
jgi:hypothetical protein